jgi:hypothetical protein
LCIDRPEIGRDSLQSQKDARSIQPRPSVILVNSALNPSGAHETPDLFKSAVNRTLTFPHLAPPSPTSPPTPSSTSTPAWLSPLLTVPLNSTFDLSTYFELPVTLEWWGISVKKWASTVPLLVVMLFTTVGNVLVVISVFTYNPLRNVQNMFLVSLAISDITVAVCVMPFSVAYFLIGKRC